MHRTIITLVVFIWAFGFAQLQSEEYLLRRLTIEVENQIIASYVDWDKFLTSTTRIGGASMVIRQSKTWEGYLGGLILSEADFYETAGLAQHASRVRSYSTSKSCLTFGGLGLIGVGLLLAATATSEDPYWGIQETNETQMAIGVSISVVGLIVEMVGLMQPRKLTPVSFAVEVADSYNKRLLKSLEE